MHIYLYGWLVSLKLVLMFYLDRKRNVGVVNSMLWYHILGVWGGHPKSKLKQGETTCNLLRIPRFMVLSVQYFFNLVLF